MKSGFKTRRRVSLLKDRRGLNTIENAILAAIVGGGAMAMWPSMNQAMNNYFKSKTESIGGGQYQMANEGTVEKSASNVKVKKVQKPDGVTENTDVDSKSCSAFAGDCTPGSI